MSIPENAADFTWKENKAFADLICEGFKTAEIEYLEALAEAVFND